MRIWRPEDADSLAFHANNPNIAANMTNSFPSPYGYENALSFIELAGAHKPTRLFAIDIDGKAVGGIGIHPQTDIHASNAELGYWIGESFWGKGFVTQMVKEMVKYTWATLPVDRIFGRCFGTNIGSQKVLQNAGFVLEATFEKTILKNGEKLDELIFAVRREHKG